MDKNPVWEFYSMSKDEYLLKSREEKLSMISDYYNQIKRVRNCFLLFFVVWIHHCLKFITGHFLNNSNGTVFYLLQHHLLLEWELLRRQTCYF